MNLKKLPRSFYARATEIVAQELLGKFLVLNKNSRQYIGKIVECEAYLGPHDLAAHSCKGITPRTRIMFGPAGYAYVYLIYGIYHCLNIVTEKKGHGAAVLLRALEPISAITERTQGPGLLCKALQIDLSYYGHDLRSDDFYIATTSQKTAFDIVAKPRIGVDYAGVWAHKPLRFYIKDNPYISKA